MAVNKSFLADRLGAVGCGIPYSISGALTLEQKYIILANAFIGFENSISNNLDDWFTEWVKNNLERVFGDVMYDEPSETITFSVDTLIGCAVHSVENEQLIIKGEEK